MSTTFSDLLDSGGATAITATGLASLASSATAGYGLGLVTFESSYLVPSMIDLFFQAKLAGSGSLANDKAVYLFLAYSIDGTLLEYGPPVPSTSAGGYAFTNSPIGASPSPTGLHYVGALPFSTGANEICARQFRIVAPPSGVVPIVLNYTGLALSSTGTDFKLTYRGRRGDGR